MDLRFARPTLRQLDQAGTEVLACCVTSDERPPHGVTGLVDWRLAGRVSRHVASGFLTGEVGEVVLLPGGPRLPFDKITIFGVGERPRFNDRVYQVVVERMLRTLEGLRVRTAVVQLPGRHFDGIAPERAADMLLESASGRQEHDVWTLVEPADAERTITQHMVQERRRVRR